MEEYIKEYAELDLELKEELKKQREIDEECEKLQSVLYINDKQIKKHLTEDDPSLADWRMLSIPKLGDWSPEILIVWIRRELSQKIKSIPCKQISEAISGELLQLEQRISERRISGSMLENAILSGGDSPSESISRLFPILLGVERRQTKDRIKRRVVLLILESLKIHIKNPDSNIFKWELKNESFDEKQITVRKKVFTAKEQQRFFSSDVVLEEKSKIAMESTEKEMMENTSTEDSGALGSRPIKLNLDRTRLYGIEVTDSFGNANCRWGLLMDRIVPCEAFPDIPVYLKDEKEASKAVLRDLGKVEWTAADESLKRNLWHYHTTLLGMVTECKPAREAEEEAGAPMPISNPHYLVVPLINNAALENKKAYHIDWDALGTRFDGSDGERADLERLRSNPGDFLIHRRGKLYLCAGVPGMPLGRSKIDDTAKSVETFEEYYKRKYNLSIDPELPLVEAHTTFMPRNALRPYESKAKGYTNIFFPVEDVVVYRLNFRKLGRLMTVLHRLEVSTRSSGLASVFGLPARRETTKLITTALTHSSSDNVNNYDRLELLGDAVLQVAVTLHLFTTRPLAKREEINEMRVPLVDNQSLIERCRRQGVERLVIHQEFVPKRFNPPYFHSPSEDIEDQIHGKMMADVVEALIGASFAIGGYNSAKQCFRWFEIPFGECVNCSCVKLSEPSATSSGGLKICK
mmetsp:Transcript_11033/g.27086  ORF Transcript_11033/g.27086 Transcript_11033/m.27086 type:complete len:693 (+) Transcript_11033:458-2536(+)